MNPGQILLEKEILLESGTNEMEVLVFRVGDFTFGINVAKVREVLPMQKITHLPKSHSAVLGCFQLRNAVVPCVSLSKFLGHPDSENTVQNVVLAEFNQHQTAFVVDAIDRIHRVNWKDVQAAPKLVTDAASPITGITNIDGRLVTMLDFETIAAQVAEDSYDQSEVENAYGLTRDSYTLLMADDSPTVRNSISSILVRSGYKNVTCFENGQDLWNHIQQQLEAGEHVADLIISDVEMPCMDGLHLTRNVKEDPQLRNIPVLLFSSILTPDNHKKGVAVGADMQITKPEIHRVVKVADELIMNRQGSSSQAGANQEPVPAGV